MDAAAAVRRRIDDREVVVRERIEAQAGIERVAGAGASAVRLAQARTRRRVDAVTLLVRLIDRSVSAGGALAVREAGSGTRRRRAAVALLAGLDRVVAAVRRRLGRRDAQLRGLDHLQALEAELIRGVDRSELGELRRARLLRLVAEQAVVVRSRARRLAVLVDGQTEALRLLELDGHRAELILDGDGLGDELRRAPALPDQVALEVVDAGHRRIGRVVEALRRRHLEVLRLLQVDEVGAELIRDLLVPDRLELGRRLDEVVLEVQRVRRRRRILAVLAGGRAEIARFLDHDVADVHPVVEVHRARRELRRVRARLVTHEVIEALGRCGRCKGRQRENDRGDRRRRPSPIRQELHRSLLGSADEIDRGDGRRSGGSVTARDVLMLRPPRPGQGKSPTRCAGPRTAPRPARPAWRSS